MLAFPLPILAPFDTQILAGLTEIWQSLHIAGQTSKVKKG